MSRTTRNHLSRAIAVTGLRAVAGLIRPEVGQAQANGPEQVFLNRAPVSTGPTLLAASGRASQTMTREW